MILKQRKSMCVSYLVCFSKTSRLKRSFCGFSLRTMELPRPILHVKSSIGVRLAMQKLAPRSHFRHPRSEILDRGALGDAKMSTTLAFWTSEERNLR